MKLSVTYVIISIDSRPVISELRTTQVGYGRNNVPS